MKKIKFTLDVDMAFYLFCFHIVQPNTYLLKKFKTVPKLIIYLYVSIQFSGSVCLTLCNPMDCSMPGFPVHHQLPEFTQTHVH